MSFLQRWCGAAACACVAMLMVLPAGAPAATARRCRSGYVRKHGKCTKKRKAKALTVPADGSYTGSNGISLTVATSGGRRNVSVRAMIPLTCASSPTENVGFLVRVMPLSGRTFTGQSAPDPEFGQTTMSGTFASAKSVHLTAQVTGYRNGADTCTGSLDVTTALRAGA